MIAMAMVALFAAVAPVQDGFEETEDLDLELSVYADSDTEEVVLNQETEYTDEIVFEDEDELSEEPSDPEDGE